MLFETMRFESPKISHWWLWIILLSVFRQGDECGGGGNGNGNSNRYYIFFPSAFDGEAVILQYINKALRSSFKGNMKAYSLKQVTSKQATQTASCPYMLNCDFTRPCRWRNVGEDGGFRNQWYMANGTAGRSQFELFTGVREQPDSPYVIAPGQKGTKGIWLVSSPLERQPGDGELQLRFWTTPFVEVKVCARRPNGKSLYSCSDKKTSRESPGPVKFNIPGPIKQKFEIVIVGGNYVTDPGGIAFVDDITYRSDLCSENGDARRASGDNDRRGSTDRIDNRRRRVLDENVASKMCRALKCSFQRGSCRYKFRGIESTKPWRRQRGPVGPIRKGKRNSKKFRDTYLLAHSSSGRFSDIYVAESSSFRVRAPFRIIFWRYQPTKDSELRVCINTLRRCRKTFTWMKQRNAGWRQEVVSVPYSTVKRLDKVKVLFAADGLTKRGYMALDDISVRSSTGESICSKQWRQRSHAVLKYIK